MAKKLTAVTFSANGRKVQAFVMCEVNENGKAILDSKDMKRIETALGAQRGDTITIG